MAEWRPANGRTGGRAGVACGRSVSLWVIIHRYQRITDTTTVRSQGGTVRVRDSGQLQQSSQQKLGQRRHNVRQ